MPELHNKMELLRERTGPLLRQQGPCLQIHFYLTLFGLKQLVHCLLCSKQGKGPNWLFDLDYLTDSMNYQTVRLENQANLHAGQQESNQNTDKKRRSPREVEQVFLDDLARLQMQEKEANEEAKALRKDFQQETENLVTQERAAKRSGTNIFSTVSTTAKASGTNFVNTVSVPVSTASTNEGQSLSDTTKSQKDDSEIPPLEDIHEDATDGIFTHSSYDDEGAKADFTNLETVVNVSPIPTSRINPSHPSALILGDPTSVVQTRSKVNKSSEAHAFVSYVQKQRRNNHKDFHLCLFACFLSATFENQKVWILLDIAYGKRLSGHRQEEGIDYDEVFAPVARLEAIRIFLAFASYMGFIVYQMGWGGGGIKGGICRKCLSLWQNDERALFMFYVDDILLGQQRRSWCDEFEALNESRFQIVQWEELTSSLSVRLPVPKGKTFTGLCNPRESSFDLESYSDSDYAGANLDRKSITGGCQFLGRRLITWQCKKQTIMATSTTEAEYVAAASCCGQVLWIQNQMLDFGFNFMNTKIYIDNESTICIVKNPVYHSKTKHIAIRHHFIRDAYEKKLIQVWFNPPRDGPWHVDNKEDAYHWSGVCQLEEMLVKALRRFTMSLRRVTDGAEAYLILTLFILCLDKVIPTIAKLLPAGAKRKKQQHGSHSSLEKTEGNVEFHEVIDFLQRSYIFHALTVSPVISTTFVEQFWTSAKSKTINNVRHITAKVAGNVVSISEASIRTDLIFDDADGIDSLPNQAIFNAIQRMGYEGDLSKVTPLFDTMLVQPTQDEGASSESQSVEQSSPSPAPTGETFTQHFHPTPPIPDSIPEPSGENLGDHSSNDTSLLGNEDDMTLPNVYDLYISLCQQVINQAKEIKILKAKIKKLKKQAKPVIKHFKAYLKTVSLQQRLSRKSSSKKQRMHKKNVSKQGRKKAKGESTVQRDPMFDVMPEDNIDHMETEDAQSEGRTKDMVDEDKEIDEVRLSTEDGVSTVKEGVSTDFEKVSTDKPLVSTDDFKVSTNEQIEGADDQVEGTEDQSKEELATQASQTSTQTPTSMIFGDDETIATLLLNMSKVKAVSKEKEKGVELKDVKEIDRPRPTSQRSLLTLKPLLKIDPKDKGKKKIEEDDESESEDDDIPQAVKKFKQLESDEELARKIQEEWEEEEVRNKIAEEEATNEALIKNFDDIKARIEADRILAEKLQEARKRAVSQLNERAKFLHDKLCSETKILAKQDLKPSEKTPGPPFSYQDQLRNQIG
ncbi:putative ribonuclease H-like domain-containing protein [Tanacetum coccineum]